MDSDSVENALPGKSSWSARLRRHFAEDITESWADAILIVTCFIAGIIDSSVYNVWSCFVSMQTGNTVYVGLGVASQPPTQPYRWLKSLTAIAFFCFGTYCFSRYMRLLSPLSRISLFTSFLLQSILIFIAAILVHTSIVGPEAGTALPHNAIVLVPLALLSFGSGGQITASRVLAYNEVPTVVLTSTYCDIFFDANLWSWPLSGNVKRNRRLLSVVFLLLGAVAGGFLTKDDKGIEGALWVCGGLKVAVAAVWLGWRSKEGRVRLE